jgi:hypothetical protein
VHLPEIPSNLRSFHPSKWLAENNSTARRLSARPADPRSKMPSLRRRPSSHSAPSMRTRTGTALPRPPLVAPAPSPAPDQELHAMRCDGGRPFRTLETSGLQTASVFLPVRLSTARVGRSVGRMGRCGHPRVYGSRATFFQFKIGMRARAPPGSDFVAGSKSPKSGNTRLESAPRLVCLIASKRSAGAARRAERVAMARLLHESLLNPTPDPPLPLD